MRQAPLFRAVFPGDWADGWLYKDHLFLWSAGGELVHSPTDRIIGEIRRMHGEDVALAAQISLFRNDWKNGVQTAAFSRSPKIRDALGSLASDAAGLAPVVVGMSGFEPVDIETVPGFLLSVSIYGNHAFLASSEGLFEANLNPRYLGDQLELLHRLEFPVHSVETNYGAVAAAAFEEGLWFDQIDFGGGGSWLSGGPLRQAADYSRAVSMASRDLLNYTDHYIPDLFVGDAVHQRQTAHSDYPSWQVTGYRRSAVQLADLTADVFGLDEAAVEAGRIRLLGNSKQRLLYEVDGYLRVMRLKTLAAVSLERQNDFGIRLDEVTSGGPAITTIPLSDGFVVETSDRVSWIGGTGVFDVTDRPAVTVRTFPQSRHFDDTALIVEEDQALLVGLLDWRR